MSTPQLDLCAAIASDLTGRTVGGFVVTASADKLLPKYELADLSATTLTVDVVPSAEVMEITQQTRGTMVEDCPVVVAIAAKCDAARDDTSYRAMLSAMREIAVHLQGLDLSGSNFHGPFTNMMEDRPESVDGDGRFEGYVTLMYRAVTAT